MTMGVILLIAQATAAPAAAPAAPPDIELTARVAVREVAVRQEGPIRVELFAEPGVSDITVERSQPAGAKSYRNLIIDARVAAWLDADAGDDKQSVSTNTETTGEEPQ